MTLLLRDRVSFMCEEVGHNQWNHNTVGVAVVALPLLSSISMAVTFLGSTKTDGCSFVFLLLETLPRYIAKTEKNVCLLSLYCWLQRFKQADTEQACWSLWETVGNINHFVKKKEQNVMLVVNGVVVETRKHIVFWHWDWLAAGIAGPPMCWSGKEHNPFSTICRGRTLQYRHTNTGWAFERATARKWGREKTDIPPRSHTPLPPI